MSEKMSAESPPVKRRGVKKYAVAIGAAQVCALIRYIALAHLLGPYELGLAVMIVITGQFFDAITDFGSDRFLIQDPDGDKPEAQSLAQFLALGRGIFIAIVLLLSAHVIANFFGTPKIDDGLRILAIAPFLMGFLHLDTRRMQRFQDYRIEAYASASAEIGSLLLTVVVALLTQSYLAIVGGLIARAALMTIVSHIMAERPYRAWPRLHHAGKLTRFSLPLLINGLLLFLGSQSDRLVISKYLGADDLGRYSAVMLLIFYPIMITQKFLSGIYLPQVTRTSEARGYASAELASLSLLIAAIASIGFVCLAPFATTIIYGPDFHQTLIIISLIAVLNTCRFLRIWPTVLLLGIGKSNGVLYSNLIRLLAFPPAIYSAIHTDSLESIVGFFFLGEFCSLLFGVFFVGKINKSAFKYSAYRLLLFFFLSLSIISGSYAYILKNIELSIVFGLLTILLTSVIIYTERVTVLKYMRMGKIFGDKRVSS